MTAVLDSWALVSLVLGRDGSETTREAIEAGGTIVSWISLGEVFYVLVRNIGRERTQTVIDDARSEIRAELPDDRIVLAAAELRVRGGVSYADCFAVATARRHEAPLLTGDPEIVALCGEVDVVDLRTAP